MEIEMKMGKKNSGRHPPNPLWLHIAKYICKERKLDRGDWVANCTWHFTGHWHWQFFAWLTFWPFDLAARTRPLHNSGTAAATAAQLYTHRDVSQLRDCFSPWIHPSTSQQQLTRSSLSPAPPREQIAKTSYEEKSLYPWPPKAGIPLEAYLICR